jgi:hypothetical protein
MKMTGGLALITIFLVLGCSNRESQTRSLPSVDPVLQEKLAGWLVANGESPEEYVVGLFSDHDVVFLGEYHRIKHDLLFVQSLAKPLYEAGVHVLATEFGRREDQPLIDSLLTAPEWDESLAREILFRKYVWWGYQEYIDIYRSAWRLNRDLPDDLPRFRILGLNDSPDWSLIKTSQDRDDGTIKRQVWRGGGEDHWAGVILEAVEAGEKVVVHSGIHHAFTEYRQPIVIEGEFTRFDGSLRCGNHVFREIGKRAVTIFFHSPWYGSEGYGSPLQHPADGIIDSFMLGAEHHPVGFDLATGPFGVLGVGDSVYRHGYENPELRNFCDGWIYTGPFSGYEGVTPISDWINESNLDRARAQSPNPAYRQASMERFNREIARSAEIPRHFGHLQ